MATKFTDFLPMQKKYNLMEKQLKVLTKCREVFVKEHYACNTQLIDKSKWCRGCLNRYEAKGN